METLTELALNFWQWSLLIVLIAIGFIINLFDKKITTKFDFQYKEYPILKPVKIATAGKGFWKMLQIWLLGSRKWVFAEDFEFALNGQEYVIPAGFKCDGASIPKFLHPFLSPTGLLLLGGVVHDHLYQYETLLKANKKDTMGVINQKLADEIFLDINLKINGFYLINKLAFWSLRLAGSLAWNKHRKANLKVETK
tara:strand:- start:3082 stop:3669 length:588 start_codon:yes stop_codon:yes gene_type:complete